MNPETRTKLLVVTLFAIAMGFLEAAVVVYLRKLYYPQGFEFPLRIFSDVSLLGIELLREIATIAMLVTLGFVAARRYYARFAYFLYAFAVWDIFYYVFLKATLDWPASLMTWDVLYLIPWPWIAPIAAPLLCTIIVIAMALFILHYEDAGLRVSIQAREWIFLVVGTALVLYTWLYDYGALIFDGGFAGDLLNLAANQEFVDVVGSYVPQAYNWPLFLFGLLIATAGVVMFAARLLKDFPGGGAPSTRGEHQIQG